MTLKIYTKFLKERSGVLTEIKRGDRIANMSKPKAERNKEIVSMHDKDPIKYSFTIIGVKYNISKQAAHRIYQREKKRQQLSTAKDLTRQQ